MMDTLDLITDSTQRILSDNCDKATLDAAETGTFATGLWNVLDDNGLTLLGTRDSGTSLADAYQVLRLAASHGLPVPLGECVLARKLLENFDAPVSGVVTLGVPGLDGGAVLAPWARAADWILVAEPDDPGAALTLLQRDVCSISPGANLAGESRDGIEFRPQDGVAVPCELSFDAVLERLALLRVVQIAGALDRTLEMSLGYAQERVQFGRPIAKFQAIQHQLAILAGEVAAAGRAADAAVDQIDQQGFAVQVAVAKSRVGEAAGVAAEIAHQVHGAMGFTHEHQLHHYTRRVWAWRDEHGNEAYWQRRLGRLVAAGGADEVWDFITQH